MSSSPTLRTNWFHSNANLLQFALDDGLGIRLCSPHFPKHTLLPNDFFIFATMPMAAGLPHERQLQTFALNESSSQSLNEPLAPALEAASPGLSCSQSHGFVFILSSLDLGLHTLTPRGALAFLHGICMTG